MNLRAGLWYLKCSIMISCGKSISQVILLAQNLAEKNTTKQDDNITLQTQFPKDERSFDETSGSVHGNLIEQQPQRWV